MCPNELEVVCWWKEDYRKEALRQIKDTSVYSESPKKKPRKDLSTCNLSTKFWGEFLVYSVFMSKMNL